MAEASNNKYSSFLFTKSNGSPIVFRVIPGPEKTLLRPLIEAGGGQLTSKENPDAINLIRPTSIAKSTDSVCSAYIQDCIKENKLLDIKNYRVSVGCQYVNQLDPNRNCLTMQSKSRSGRKAYLPSEDINIIRYVLEEERYKDVGGVNMWKKMENVKIVNHTWQSTKDHFLTQILPNIKHYDLSTEDVAKFQKNVSSAKGSVSRKQAAKVPLAFIGKDQNVEGSDEEEEEEVETEDEDDEFDQSLFQLAKSYERMDTDDNADPAGKGKLGEDADSEPSDESNIRSKYFPSADKDETKKMKGLRGLKKRHTTASDAMQMEPSAGPEKSPDRNSATKARSVLGSNSPGHANMLEVQNMGEGMRLRNSRSKTCSTEIAAADSQNDRIVAGSESVRPKHILTIDSSMEPETEDEPEEVFPVKVYNSGGGYRKGQQKKKTTMHAEKGNSTSKTTDQKTTSPQPSTSRQTAEVNKKLHKESLKLRNFIMGESSRVNSPENMITDDISTQPTDILSNEQGHAMFDKLADWLGISPECFIQAVYRCNGSVECAVRWLLNGSGETWDPHDDCDLYSESEAKVKVLYEKYSSKFIAERMNFLEDHPALRKK